MDRVEIRDENGDVVNIAGSFHAPPESLSADTPRQKEEQPKIGLDKRVILMVMVVSLLSSILAVTAYDRFFVQKIATINPGRYMEHQRDLYLAGNLTADQVKQNLDSYIASVKAAPGNKVIILEDVVANTSNTEKLEPR